MHNNAIGQAWPGYIVVFAGRFIPTVNSISLYRAAETLMGSLLGVIVLISISTGVTASQQPEPPGYVLQLIGGQQPLSTSPAGPRIALIEAARAGDDGVVADLIKFGSDITATDQLGRTALHYAARLGHADIVSRLIAAGAPINSVDKGEFTPLLRAIQGGHTAIVARLLDVGADIKMRSLAGDTAQSLAQRVGDPALIALIKEALAAR